MYEYYLKTSIVNNACIEFLMVSDNFSLFMLTDILNWM